MEPLISVIIPTYKPGHYIWECLDSIRNQTLVREQYEVILVLNGCKSPYDNSLREYIAKYPEVNWNYIQTDLQGVSNARNLALNEINGEYVAFIDDDDYISPTYLEELLTHSSLDTIALCYPYAFYDGHSETQLPYEITNAYERYKGKGKLKASRIRDYFSGPCMKLIPASYIGERRFDVRFKNGEDTIFMFLISDCMKWVDFTSKKAVYYRRFRTNSAVTTRLSLGYVFGNCWRRICEYTRIYFSAPRKYSFRRYSMNLLGTAHILLSRLLTGKI